MRQCDGYCPIEKDTEFGSAGSPKVSRDVIARILIQKSDLLNSGSGRIESATGKESVRDVIRSRTAVSGYQFYQFQFN